MRRRAVAAAAAACAIALAPLGPVSASSGAPVLAHQPVTPIHHFVVLLQENHTFDNYFGTYPGADVFPTNTCVPVNPAVGRTPCIRPFHIGNRSITDLDHSESTAVRDLDKGRMDGFVRAQALRVGSGSQAMGYYDDRDLPFY